MNMQIEILCHLGVSHQMAENVLKGLANDLMDAIEIQLFSRRPQCVVVTQETKSESLLFLAGTRKYFLATNFPTPQKNTDIFVVAMPHNCELARQIQAEMRGDRNQLRFDLDERSLMSQLGYENN